MKKIHWYASDSRIEAYDEQDILMGVLPCDADCCHLVDLLNANKALSDLIYMRILRRFPASQIKPPYVT